jgi:hypothetical protein
MSNQVQQTSASRSVKAILSDSEGEIWRGTLRQFYRDNNMDRAAARDIHAQVRRYGDANVGGGASGDFKLLLSSGG